MPTYVIVILAIALVVVLALIFIILYRINKKIPLPKGARELERSEFNCSHCNHEECEFFIGKKSDEESKKKEEKK